MNYKIIVNPIAGYGQSLSVAEQIFEWYKEEVALELIPTAQDKSIADIIGEVNADDVIVAMGGDGTINMVGRYCYEHQLRMGIIPTGSGNGLARHLELSLTPFIAFRNIIDGKDSIIDIAQWNKEFFFNVAGIGFDGYVAHLFNASKQRGFGTYVRAIHKAIRSFEKGYYELEIDGKVINTDAVLISFANSSQYGNDTYIAPGAKLGDGLLDIVVVKKINWWNVFRLGMMIKSKKLERAKSVSFYKGKRIIINKFDSSYAHIDGEPLKAENSIAITVIPKALRIIK